MQSVMSHNFSRVPSVNIQRSVFDRSHGYKTTFDGGYLVPVFADEVLPGDTFDLQPSFFARLATPKVPMMDNLHLDIFFFYVPNRLLWENWQRFCGERTDPDDSTDYLVPQITAPSGGWLSGSVHDYFGLPVGVTGIKANALHFRAMNLIYNEWFRDQNLQNSLTVAKGDSGDPTYTLLKRNKKHDYFTSCLPWPQKGEAVSIGLPANAPVVGNGKAIGFSTTYPTTTGYGLFDYNDGTNHQLQAYSTAYNLNTGGTVTGGGTWPTSMNGLGLSTEAGKSGVIADLSAASAVTINALREAFQVQKMLEKDARGGTRYVEILLSHFGVQSPDFRLQRPEYLGGGTMPVNINPVAQTSKTDVSGTPQGNLAAFGVAASRGYGFSKSFVEHGVILGFICARADLTYQRCLNRMWSRQTRYDFYWPSLANIGEQVVWGKEIYCDGTIGDESVFGYQERFAEYRYKPSQITGIFRSVLSSGTTLHYWHLSQNFGSRPVLNEDFMADPTTTVLSRVVAVDSEPDFLLDCYFNLRCARPMPVFSVPGLIDHF